MEKEKSAVREALRDLEIVRRKYVQQSVAALGLTWGQGQARILDKLLTRDHVTQKELSDVCGIDVTTMSRTLDRLEEAGYLCRKKPPDCRRSYQIALTGAGREKARQVRAMFERLDEGIWRDFEGQEMEAVLAGLKKITKNLGALYEADKKR